VRAVVKAANGPGHIELRHVPEPELVPGSVRVRVAAVGICGTDRRALDGSYSYRTPLILGHEVSGRVVEAAPDLDPANIAGLPGDHADKVAVGDRVTLETDAYLCGRCPACRGGDPQWCPLRKGIGTTVDGGMADEIVIRAPSARRLPDELSLTGGALVEPLAIAVRQVLERSVLHPGDLAVVFGPGAIGLAAAQVAAAAGARVVLAGRARHRERLELALQLGIPYALATDAEDLTALVDALSEGRGADVVYECSGARQVLEGAPALIRKGGQLVLVAYFDDEPPLDLRQLVEQELSVVGSRGKRPVSYTTALRLVAEGRVQLEPLVTHRLPLESWADGFELLGGGHKVVLEVSENG
jgi:L-iditol 2-dehydrogenase